MYGPKATTGFIKGENLAMSQMFPGEGWSVSFDDDSKALLSTAWHP